MNIGFIYSAALHVLIFLLIFFGLPTFSKKLPNETAISVEILPIRDVSNVAHKKPQQNDQKNESKTIVKASNDNKSPVVQQEPKTKAEALNTPKPEESQNKPKAPKENIKPEKNTKPEKDIKPIPTNIKQKEAVKEKAEPKPKNTKPTDQPKKKEQKAKAQNSELDSLLKTLDTPSATKTEKAKENKQNSSKDNNQNSNSNKEFDNTEPLSLSEEAAIRSQIYKNWLIPIGAKDIGKMSVVLRITLAQDGTVNTVKIIEENTPSKGDVTIFRAFVDSAIRAIHMSNPIQNLPIEKYKNWQEIELNFDPREMVD